MLINIKECCLAKSSTETSSSGRAQVLSTYPSGMVLSDVVVIMASSAVKDAIAGSTSTIFKLTLLNQILNCCCRVCAVSINNCNSTEQKTDREQSFVNLRIQ